MKNKKTLIVIFLNQILFEESPNQRRGIVFNITSNIK